MRALFLVLSLTFFLLSAPARCNEEGEYSFGPSVGGGGGDLPTASSVPPDQCGMVAGQLKPQEGKVPGGGSADFTDPADGASQVFKSCADGNATNI